MSKISVKHAPDEVVLEAVGGLCVGGEAVQSCTGGGRSVVGVGMALLGANLLVQALVQMLSSKVLQLLKEEREKNTKEE